MEPGTVVIAEEGNELVLWVRPGQQEATTLDDAIHVSLSGLLFRSSLADKALFTAAA